ncbi:MAG: prephenate dehydratase domain-containing protein [Candidatus Peribacteraceae bacterium]
MIIYTLGPAGTFSHEAAEQLFPGERIRFAPNFDALFAVLQKQPNAVGVVPIENSLHGSVDEILDLLYETKVRIVRTNDLAIKHAFGAMNQKRIRKIASHSQVLRQCRLWLKNNFPQAEHIPVSSTAAAVILAAKDPSIGAIASKKLLKKSSLKIFAEDIEGEGNTTRFAIIAVKNPFPNLRPRHISIVLRPTGDRPGLLHDLLTPFKVYDVNLTRIESRPAGTRIGEYVFFVDLEGDSLDARTRKVFEELKRFAEITVLGEW